MVLSLPTRRRSSIRPVVPWVVMLVPAQRFSGQVTPFVLKVSENRAMRAGRRKPEPPVSLAIEGEGLMNDLVFEELKRDCLRKCIGHVRDEDKAWQAVKPRLVLRAFPVNSVHRAAAPMRPGQKVSPSNVGE